ncbi:MAG: sigma-70 family RNA polymerase sigma factor [Bryobacterales bacterium]|nr:sigma-70 family RNA polymerase sigma factor [Bryobacterales bacterium]
MSVLHSSAEVTRMLRAWKGGDASALERLTPVVYAELYRIASRNLAGERQGHLLQPSALVNEAFLRLLGDKPVEWASRAHFFAFSARLMRQILIDFARAQETVKRGHRQPHLGPSTAGDIPGGQPDPIALLDVDAALTELKQLNESQAKLVELRYFGGLDNAEIAVVLGISEPTVVRRWRLARAWLYDRLQSGRGRCTSAS